MEKIIAQLTALDQLVTNLASDFRHTDGKLNKLIIDSEELESRTVRIEQQIEISSHAMKNFWERDISEMVKEMKSLNEKLQLQLAHQVQQKSEVEMVKQRMDMVCKVYDEKLSKLEKSVEDNRLALWKLVGAGAGSGAVITGLIEVINSLVK